MPRLTPSDLARCRRTLYAGDQIDAATARRLMDEIDALRAELAHALRPGLAATTLRAVPPRTMPRFLELDSLPRLVGPATALGGAHPRGDQKRAQVTPNSPTLGLLPGAAAL